METLRAELAELRERYAMTYEVTNLRMKLASQEHGFGNIETLQALIEITAKVRQVSPERLISRMRPQWLSESRWIVFTLARKHTDLSLTVIGDALNKDHGSVLHGIHGSERLLSLGDKAFTRDFALVETELLARKKLCLISDKPASAISPAK